LCHTTNILRRLTASQSAISDARISGCHLGLNARAKSTVELGCSQRWPLSGCLSLQVSHELRLTRPELSAEACLTELSDPGSLAHWCTNSTRLSYVTPKGCLAIFEAW
jgi:hypothetical protein